MPFVGSGREKYPGSTGSGWRVSSWDLSRITALVLKWLG
jgi:hypothetical protein